MKKGEIFESGVSRLELGVDGDTFEIGYVGNVNDLSNVFAEAFRVYVTEEEKHVEDFEFLVRVVIVGLVKANIITEGWVGSLVTNMLRNPDLYGVHIERKKKESKGS